MTGVKPGGTSVTENRSELLSQLKIDRSSAPATPGRPGLWLGLAAGALVLVLAGYFLLRPSSAITVKAVTVSAAPAGGQTAASVLDATGYVVARRQATVSSKVTGKVTDVLIEEGQHVKEGEVLARIDDTNVRAQLELARANLGEVKVQLADAERQLKRATELSAQKLVSEAALDTAQANVDAFRARLQVTQRSVDVQQRLLDDTVVRAPFSGVITVKNAQPGEMISPLSAGGAGTRTGIGTLVDMDSLEIEVDVNENFINRVQPGQPVAATLNAYPDWKIPCAVIAVIPAADRSKATVKVRIGFKERDPKILPDMGARVNFLSEPIASPDGVPAAPATRIPADTVVDDKGTAIVYVIKGDKVERRAVKLGGKDSQGVQVLAGVSAGERLAAGDLSKLTDGAKVKIAQ
jgi:RND family efflux transporter MFP subunit